MTDYDRGWWRGWAWGFGPYALIQIADHLVSYERAEAAGRFIRNLFAGG